MQIRDATNVGVDDAPVLSSSVMAVGGRRPGKKKKAVKSSKVVPAAAVHESSGSVTRPQKKWRVRSPVGHLKSLRDAYVSFMMSLANNNQFTLGGVSLVGFGSWPCPMEAPAAYPGRQPRIDDTPHDELFQQTYASNASRARLLQSSALKNTTI